MKLNVKGHLKCLLWHLASLLWTEHKFNYGITGREDVNDDACPGCLSDENIEAVKKTILDNHRITIREVADDVNISFGSCQAILTDTAKIVPKFLNFEQKQRSTYIAQEMLTMFNDNPNLLKKVITGNESWVYSNGTKSKHTLWKVPGPRIESIKA